jgi:hypothetical protein
VNNNSNNNDNNNSNNKNTSNNKLATIYNSMNLSDLVHRTAGDNKVLASNFETSANTMITPSSTSQPPQPPPSSFEHNITEFATIDPSSFQRQQQEAYLFPMQVGFTTITN